jgi:transposase InsO family protein
VVWWFAYVALRRVLGLLLLRGRSQRAKDLEIIVLRHELQILRRQVRRPELQPADRAFLAAASQVLSRRANAHAERFVGTIRRDCLDWILIRGRRHLQDVLQICVDHYNSHRPHRALGLEAPDPRPHPPPTSLPSLARVRRRDRLGGLIHEYDITA